jgi:hypothetical protein
MWIWVSLLLILPSAYGDSLPMSLPGFSASSGKYHFATDLQIGYPFVTLTNPDGTEAHYDGIAVKINGSIPLYDGVMTDVFLQGGLKYFDLLNTSSSDSQFEDANMIGPGAGLAVRLFKLWFGAQYYQMWARHSATGKFSGRSNYNFQTIDLFGGIHYDFGRLGIGVLYSASSTTIGHSGTRLQTDTPYSEGIVSLQVTYSFGETLWSILGGLF